MRDWDAARVAAAVGGEVLADAPAGPLRVVIDSRAIAPGDLFFGLPGANVDGGQFAEAALAAGAWGVVVAGGVRPPGRHGAVIAVEDPVRALGRLASAWRDELGATVVGITGSVGKTSTKELVAALIATERRVVASRENFNTEIGLPLEVLAAPAGTEVLVLEMAMRGRGQIAELAEIARPDVGVITNIGPVHLELLGSLEAIAAAKAELIEALSGDGVAVLPSAEPLLDAWRDGRQLTFGPGGDVDWQGDAVTLRGSPLDLQLDFAAGVQRLNAPAAVAAAIAAGVQPRGRVGVPAGHLRGERVPLARGALVIDDCYNANPLSMRAALDDLAAQDTAARRVAVLGDMLELGADAEALHRDVGAYARRRGVEVLVTVGPLAAAMADSFEGASYAAADAAEAATLADEIVQSGDVVLVKGSRGVGLEVVARELSAADG